MDLPGLFIDFNVHFHGTCNVGLAFAGQAGRKPYGSGAFAAFFEWLFFLAMLFFEKKCPQVIILETGLGGRLDATNVIDPPAVCVITRIGLDHMEYLGNTCGQIAGEKAGIIKPGSRVIYSTMRQESEQVIERKAAECGCS